MCGICGIINKKNPNVDRDMLVRMTRILAHRGPDGEGVFIDKNAGLGHRRLAIIDLSENAKQPMSNEDGTIWIVFNGMIYNFKELKEGLESKGHRFKSHSDTETIIHLYEEVGIDCVKSLRGMFAFAIWDSKRKELILARDRIGQKPLVYVDSGDSFIFASESKAIFATRKVVKQIDMTGMHHFFSYMNAPWPYTMYKNIKQLPPACILKFKLGDNAIKIDNYWKPNLNTKLNISIEEAADKLFFLLQESINLQLISDVPIGALLSGGIDSSSIVAMASRLLNHPIETFSIGYQTIKKKDPEFSFSRIVSSEFNTNHHQISVNHNIINILPEVLWYYDEPYANPVALPNFLLCKIIKKKVTVVLSGDGGDEIFGGYPGYARWKVIGFFNRFIPFRYKFSYDNPALVHKKSFLIETLGTIFACQKEKRSLRKNIFSRWLYNNLYTPETQKEIQMINSGRILEEFYMANNPRYLLDGILFMDLVLYNAHGVSLISDISGMSNGLEIRAPFLDHKLIEFVFSLPIAYKIKGYAKMKHILRQAMKEVLPKRILLRKKVGYGEGIPFNTWFRNQWKKSIEQFLFEGGLKESRIFEMNYVKKLFDNHMGQKQDNLNILWSLVCFSVWYENVFMKN
ncbi:MAG: asparagine synthase (glutamine-hydrolyzing) [Candidatus Omnitrophota bacterium]|nr:asparagine synthase (glutamine-hydrolyzing) [Candidatus Omnitrophota bacterium]